jgi:hypothetical protein
VLTCMWFLAKHQYQSGVSDTLEYLEDEGVIQILDEVD